MTRPQSFQLHPLMVQMEGDEVSRIDVSTLLFQRGVAAPAVNDYPQLNAETLHPEGYYSDRFHRERNFRKGCAPLADLMDNHKPSCLRFHETSMVDFSRGQVEQLRLVGRGTMRDAWMTLDVDGAKLALKTLYYGATRDYNHFAFDVHQVDAAVMGQLTASPYATNIYGFCSASAIVQYGEGLLRDIFHEPFPVKDDLLRIAHNVAAAVADVHQYNDDGEATFADDDIKPDQFLLVDGIFKLNDFNQGRPKWRNPANEEQECEIRKPNEGEVRDSVWPFE